MKLNEFQQVNELDLAHVVGDYGAAGLKQIGNRIMGRPEGQLSVKDKMASEKFIRDFVGRAKTDLNSAIQSGLVDPNATGATPTTAPTPTANTTPNYSSGQQTVAPSSISYNIKPTTATKPTTTTTPTKSAPLTPAQTRQQKLSTAANVAQKQMSANPVVTKATTTPPATPSPEEIRKAKQSAAAAFAQKQMVPYSKLPANQTAIQSANIRQQKQTAAAQNANQQAVPFSKFTPAPAVWKNNRNPSAPAKRSPTLESTFDKLNTVFEAIVDPQQATQKMTIAQYVKRMFTKYLKGVNINDPQVQQQLNTLAQEVQNSKGSRESLTKLANLAYSVSYADNNGDGVPDTQQAKQGKLSALDAISAGVKQGLGQTTGKEIDTAKEPQKAQTVYAQIKALIPKMDKKGKQRIVAYLDKQLGVAPTTATPEPSAMTNMARQLSARGTTSTGGTQNATGMGVRHTASPTNPNQAPKVDTRLDKAKKTRAVKKEKIANAPYVPA